MKCVSYTRTIPWKNHKGELTIADQNQRIAEYLAEHKELNLQKRYSDRKNAENAGAAFDKMIDDGVEQKFDCIIVASMYYCGPDFPAARQAIKETLYETGVNLIVLEEGLDTRSLSLVLFRKGSSTLRKEPMKPSSAGKNLKKRSLS